MWALRSLREEMGWSQDDLAARIGTTRRTLGNWENGYWLPEVKERVHIVVAVHDAPPACVLAVADALGLTRVPAVAPLLDQYRSALRGPSEPPRPRPSAEALRVAVDAVVHPAADALDVRSSDLRAAVARVLTVCVELGADLGQVRAAVATPSAKG
jgi:DNA-binding XRE family transcriptional regulator